MRNDRRKSPPVIHGGGLAPGKISSAETLVRKEGFEPPRPFGHKILSLARLPVPPLPHRNSILSVGVARFHRDFAQASFGREGIRSAGKQRF